LGGTTSNGLGRAALLALKHFNPQSISSSCVKVVNKLG